MLYLSIISVAFSISSVLSFIPFNGMVKIQSKSLYMGGGRSLEERGKSNRVMFKELKSKFNEAAKAPGFFEVGEGPAVIDLYCKSNKDGTQIGDCPFAQFVQLVLLKKGLKYNVRPTISSAKPEWLLEKHDGKMPCLVHSGTSITDSLAIAEYIEKAFPYNSLTRQGAYSYREVIDKTSGFFPALSTFIKNTDDSKDPELLAAVEQQLDVIDEIIRSSPGQYICGIEMTLADLYLLPQLFHAMVAMDHFKDVEFYHVDQDPTRPALENYLSKMFAIEEFNNKKAYYNVDQVVYGWKSARGEN